MGPFISNWADAAKGPPWRGVFSTRIHVNGEGAMSPWSRSARTQHSAVSGKDEALGPSGSVLDVAFRSSTGPAGSPHRAWPLLPRWWRDRLTAAVAVGIGTRVRRVASAGHRLRRGYSP